MLKTTNKIDTDDLSTITGLTLVRDYLPYTPSRIKQIMRDDYNIELIWTCPYKGGRYPGYRRKYSLVDITTKTTVKTWVSLDDLRYFLAPLGYPLKAPKIKRNPKCDLFLEAVKAAEKAKKFESV